MNAPSLFSIIHLSDSRCTILPLKVLLMLLATLLLMAAGCSAAQSTPVPPAGTTSVHLASPLRPLFTVTPGGSYPREIVLANRGEQAVTVQVSQVDFLPTDEGSSYPEPGSLSRSNAPWIKLGRSDVQIPAGTEVVVPYSIHVPNDPSLAGSYWSMILLTPSDATGVQEMQESEVQTTLRTQFRYGVSVVTNLGDSGESRLSFENPQFARPGEGAAAHLQVSLQNTGEQLMSPEVQLELFNAGGMQVDRFEAQAERIFPGTSVRQDFDLGTLTSGVYTAVVIADAGGEAVFGTRYTLNVGDSDTP